MGKFIGTIGGLGMVLLICILACRFLKEMGLKAKWNEMGKVLIPVAAFALLELMIAGIYFTVKESGTSILEISVIWKEKNLFLTELFPFNWYLSLLFGCSIFWNVYRILRNGAKHEEAVLVIWLLLICPGAYLLFLPTVWSPLFAVLAAFLRFADALCGEKAGTTAGKFVGLLKEKMGAGGYLAVFTVIALLCGTKIILDFGI